MRGKRGKQYRKLMAQFQMTFGFREPYQVLVDAELVKDMSKSKIELLPALQRTVQGTVKGMITQCEIRKLYAQNKEPGVAEAIEVAKTLERRRCGHHPDEHPEPLDTLSCLESVIDPKDNGSNKNCYVVACQDQDVRRALRTIRGVPQIYMRRSVMILEPMADESVQLRVREEKAKFRAGLTKNALGKRKRTESSGDEDKGKDGDDKDGEDDADGSAPAQKKADKKKKYGQGPKNPNPLAVKKKKSGTGSEGAKKSAAPADTGAAQEGAGKRKRRKRNTTSQAAGEGDAAPAAAGGDDN